MLYLPLEKDFVDQSGQETKRVFSTYELSYTKVGGVNSVHIGTKGGAKLTTPYGMQNDRTKPLTVSILIYVTSQQTSSRRTILDIAATNQNRLWMVLYENTNDIRMSSGYGETTQYAELKTTTIANQWMHILYTVSQDATKLYLNGELKASGKGGKYPRGNREYSHDNTQGIFCTRDVNSYSSALNGNARELIIEQIERSAEDVANYYKWIKQKLGL